MFVDLNFVFYVIMIKFIGGLFLDFSDSFILFLDVVCYVKVVKIFFDWFEVGLGFNKINILIKFVYNVI